MCRKRVCSTCGYAPGRRSGFGQGVRPDRSRTIRHQNDGRTRKQRSRTCLLRTLPALVDHSVGLGSPAVSVLGTRLVDDRLRSVQSKIRHRREDSGRNYQRAVPVDGTAPACGAFQAHLPLRKKGNAGLRAQGGEKWPEAGSISEVSAACRQRPCGRPRKNWPSETMAILFCRRERAWR